MQIINQNAHTNKEGKLTITIPTEHKDADVELVVVINPLQKNTSVNSELTEEEIALVEERWEEYQKNPDKTISWEEVKNSVSKKHGL
jgi:putative addiction module component (TIGR02574 family)